MCSARLPATPRSSWPTRRWPGEIPAVPTLITELGVSGVLFTADAALPEGQLHTGRRNGLLVQVKQNQPILHETLARLCAEHRPFDSHETGGVARSIGWSSTLPVSWTPSGSR
jgi:hypothetical protein